MRYQLHRPRELSRFTTSGATKDTAGPILINGQPTTLTQEQVEKLYQLGVEHGARPCRRDTKSGCIHLGHFVFVPEETS